MNLKNYEFEESYINVPDSLAVEFYKPALNRSIEYKRLVAYFTSSAFALFNIPLRKFINKGGKLRFILSHHVTEEDYEAIREGYDSRIKNNIDKNINDFIEDNPSNSKYIKLLTYLIENNHLEVKIAFTQNPSGLVHLKRGIFRDIDNNYIAFSGSSNETFMGLSEKGNHDDVEIYCSWKSKDKSRSERHNDDFENYWNNNKEPLKVIDFPDVIKKDLIKKFKPKDQNEVDSLLDFIENQSAEKNNKLSNFDFHKLRKNQKRGYKKWLENGNKGILSHATGSGKTITALYCIKKLWDNDPKIIPMIIVPSVYLLEQWEQEINKFFNSESLSILKCGGGNKWSDYLSDWTDSSLSTQYRIIISTADTSKNKDFINRINTNSKLFLLSDEVHRLGAEKRSNVLEINAKYRLGLSATHVRRDKDETEKIINYFDGVVDTFSLQDAIDEKILRNYYYYTRSVELDEEEEREYKELSNKISKLSFLKNKDKDHEYLELLKIQRANIIKKANGKISQAINMLEDEQIGFKKNDNEKQFWLIYCADNDQVDEIMNILLEKNYPALKYTSEMISDREKTINYFLENGGILVCINMLDEGIDIPMLTDGIIISSSSSERQFIQRRGRFLRRKNSSDFSSAKIRDILVFPKENSEIDKFPFIQAELKRALEFAKSSINKGEFNKIKAELSSKNINTDELDYDEEYLEDGN